MMKSSKLKTRVSNLAGRRLDKLGDALDKLHARAVAPEDRDVIESLRTRARELHADTVTGTKK